MTTSGDGKYIGLGSNGAERTTMIVDIFNIIQQVRNTGSPPERLRLVDGEPKR